MSEFCKCGFLIINGNCTNRNCNEHKKSLVEEATYSQIEFIKNLSNRLNEDLNIEFTILSKKEASNLINKLLERLDNEQ